MTSDPGDVQKQAQDKMDELADKGQEMMEQARDAAEQQMDATADAVDAAKDQTDAALDAAKDQTDAAKDAVQDAAQDAQQQATAAADDVAATADKATTNAGEQLEQAANAMRDHAPQGKAGEFVQAAASRVEQTGESLKKTNIKDVTSGVARTVQEKPEAKLLGGVLLAGAMGGILWLLLSSGKKNKPATADVAASHEDSDVPLTEADLSKVLIKAHQQAEKILAAAQQQADKKVGAAEQQADKIVKGAQKKADAKVRSAAIKAGVIPVGTAVLTRVIAGQQHKHAAKTDAVTDAVADVPTMVSDKVHQALTSAQGMGDEFATLVGEVTGNVRNEASKQAETLASNVQAATPDVDLAALSADAEQQLAQTAETAKRKPAKTGATIGGGLLLAGAMGGVFYYLLRANKGSSTPPAVS